MRYVGTEQGVLTVKTSLAHVFSLFNKDFLRPLYARHCFNHLGYISAQNRQDPCSHSEWRAITERLFPYLHIVSVTSWFNFTVISNLIIRYLLLPTENVSFYFHITTMHTSLPSPTALHTQSRKIAYQGIEGLARTLTGKWH